MMPRRVATVALFVLTAALVSACSSETEKLPPAVIGGALSTPGRPAVVEFASKTCPPCLQMEKVMADLQARLGDRVDFRLVYVEEHRHLFPRFGIALVPTLIFVDAQGQEVARHLGPLAREELLAKLRQLNFIP